MAFWSSETLKDRIPLEELINPYREDRVKRGAYELSVGPDAYVTSTSGAKTRLSDGERIIIPPGQFGLLVTSEIVAVPHDAMAFLSIKSTTKLQGLVNVSGFHVDPGYKNTLKFAVYNAGPQNIYLDQGQEMFLIWYAALDRPTRDIYVPRPGMSKNISAEDVKRIAGDVASPAELKKQIDDLKQDIEKHFHKIEQGQLWNRYLYTLIVGMLVTVFGRAYLLPLLREDGETNIVAPMAEKEKVESKKAQTEIKAKADNSIPKKTVP